MRAMRFAAGVHASGGFGIGGPIHPATLNPSPEEEVYLESVIMHLQYYIRKLNSIRYFWFHLFFLTIVIVISILRGSSESVKSANEYIKSEIFKREEFVGSVRSVDEFFVYLAKVMKNSWRTRRTMHQQTNNASIVAVNIFAVRQIRAKLRWNEKKSEMQYQYFFPAASDNSSSSLRLQEEFFPWNFSSWNALGISVLKFVVPSQLDSEPKMNTGNLSAPFHSLETMEKKAWVFKGTSVRTAERTYPATLAQYPLGPLRYKDIQSEVEIDLLLLPYQSGSFLSIGAQAVLFDVVLFEPYLNHFFYNIGVFQILDGVRVVNRLYCHPFMVRSLKRSLSEGTSNKSFYWVFVILPLVLDVVLILVCCVGNLYSVAKRIQLNHLLDGKWFVAIFRFWELFDFFLSILLLVVALGHMYLTWISTLSFDTAKLLQAETSDFVPEVESMNFLVHYAYVDRTIAKIRAWCVLLTIFRSFYLIQFISRLAVVTETLRSSSNEIFGVLCVFFIFVFGFSVSGVYLFGANSNDFTTLTNAFSFFVQLIGSGELTYYQDYEALTWTAALFFLLFFFIAYFVMLNVIIGILAASFVTVVESFDLVRRADWSLVSLKKDFLSLFRRLRKHRDKKEKESLIVPIEETPAFLAATEAERRKARMEEQEQEGVVEEEGGGGDGKFLIQPCETTEEAYLRLLRTLISLRAKGSNREEMITLRQLRNAGTGYVSVKHLNTIFSKSQAQIGTRNGKVRQVRLLERRMKKGEILMNEVSHQFGLMHQVREAILGTNQNEKEKAGDPPPPTAPPAGENEDAKTKEGGTWDNKNVPSAGNNSDKKSEETRLRQNSHVSRHHEGRGDGQEDEDSDQEEDRPITSMKTDDQAVEEDVDPNNEAALMEALLNEDIEVDDPLGNVLEGLRTVALTEQEIEGSIRNEEAKMKKVAEQLKQSITEASSVLNFSKQR